MVGRATPETPVLLNPVRRLELMIRQVEAACEERGESGENDAGVGSAGIIGVGNAEELYDPRGEPLDTEISRDARTADRHRLPLSYHDLVIVLQSCIN